MAITGRFEADFSSFQAAVQGAELSLRSFETNSHKVESALARMTDNFSGRKVIQDATVMAEAVERVGGTAKLTEAEFARLGAAAREAVAKMTALGIEVPAHLQTLSDATTQAAGSVKTLGSQFAEVNRILGAFGVALSVGAVVNFGRQVIDAGSAIGKMAAQTGMSTDEVQRFQFIAGQTSVEIGSMIGGLQTLQERLGDDNTGAAGAMKKLGIHSEAFRRLSPYDQVLALSDALRNETDVNERANLGAQLFGRTWKEIGPAIVDNMREIGDQASVMSKSAQQSLDDADKALKRLGQTATTQAGQIVLFFEQIDKANLQWSQDFHDPAGAAVRDAEALAGAMAKIPPPTMAAAASLGAMSLSAAELTYTEKELTDRVKESIEAHQKEADELKKVVDAQKQATAEIQTISDTLSGNEAITAATKMADAIGNVGNVANFSAEAQKRIAETTQAAIEAMIGMGLATDPLIDTFVALNLKATEYIRSIQDVAAATAAATAEQQRLNAEMERAFTASGGTDLQGFRSGLVGTGQSAQQPFVGLKPSVFAAGGVAGVNTPGTYNTVNISGVLLSTNPAAKAEFGQYVSDIIGDRVKGSRKVSPF